MVTPFTKLKKLSQDDIFYANNICSKSTDNVCNASFLSANSYNNQIALDKTAISRPVNELIKQVKKFFFLIYHN